MTLATHAAATGINAPDVATLKGVWAALCGDMPGVLLAPGLAEVLKRWTNTWCLPSPGAVWEQVDPALAKLRGDLAILERARAETDEPLDPLDRAPSPKTDAVIAETMKLLRAATAQGFKRGPA